MQPSRHLILTALAAVLVFVASGYILDVNASPTTQPSAAGDGTVQVSQQQVSNVHYILMAADSDPTTVDGVSFDLTSSPRSIYVSLSGGPFFTCATSGTVLNEDAYPWHPVCDLTANSPTVLSVTSVRVVAAD